MFIQCLPANQYVHKLMYSTCLHEAMFMLLTLLPKRGECRVSLEVRHYITILCNHIKVPAIILLAASIHHLLSIQKTLEFSIDLLYYFVTFEVTTHGLQCFATDEIWATYNELLTMQKCHYTMIQSCGSYSSCTQVLPLSVTSVQMNY